MYLLLPLFAAVAFAIGSMVYKRAFAEGAGVAHAVVVNNAMLAVVFLPLMALESGPIPWAHWHQPVLTAVAFVIGHLFNVLSLKAGAVSLATPLLGAKVVMVAAIARWTFGVPLTAAQWWAAVLTTLGVFVMGAADWRGGKRTGVTVVLALGCAAAFAFTDISIQAWATGFGPFHFLPLVHVALALLSAACLPAFGPSPLRAPRAAWPWILGGAVLSGLQSILVTGTIAIWKDAPGVNVVYATRGVWSVVLVWFAGHWFANSERRTAGVRGMAFRLAGAALILGAVVLAMQRAGSAAQ